MTEAKLNVFLYFTDRTFYRTVYSLDELRKQNDKRKNYGLYLVVSGTIKKVEDIVVQSKDYSLMSIEEYLHQSKPVKETRQATSQTVRRTTATTKAASKTK